MWPHLILCEFGREPAARAILPQHMAILPRHMAILPRQMAILPRLLDEFRAGTRGNTAYCAMLGTRRERPGGFSISINH